MGGVGAAMTADLSGKFRERNQAGLWFWSTTSSF